MPLQPVKAPSPSKADAGSFVSATFENASTAKKVAEPFDGMLQSNSKTLFTKVIHDGHKTGYGTIGSIPPSPVAVEEALLVEDVFNASQYSHNRMRKEMPTSNNKGVYQERDSILPEITAAE